MAEKILMREFKALSKEKWVRVELCNEKILEWDIGLMMLNPDSPYHGGYFKAKMEFPENYPYMPPKFTFNRPLFHPNIYKNGKLCISILHAPGEDALSGEKAAERWSPIQGVESVLLSIISLLDDAECSSPANVDAAVCLRMSREKYDRRVREDVDASRKDIPPGFEMPSEYATAPPPPPSHDDGDFWYDSDEGDFGGSESDEEMEGAEEDESEDDEDEDDEDEEKAEGDGEHGKTG